MELECFVPNSRLQYYNYAQSGTWYSVVALPRFLGETGGKEGSAPIPFNLENPNPLNPVLGLCQWKRKVSTKGFEFHGYPPDFFQNKFAVDIKRARFFKPEVPKIWNTPKEKTILGQNVGPRSAASEKLGGCFV